MKKTTKHIPHRALYIAVAILWVAVALVIWQSYAVKTKASFTTAGISAAKTNAIPSSLKRFKEVLDKNIDIGVSDLNKNYLDYIGSLEETVPLKVNNLNSIAAIGTQFFKEYGKHFGILNFKTDLKLTNTTQDSQGQNYLSFHQYYKDIPVYGGELIVQVDNDFKVHSGYGKFFTKVSASTKPKIMQDKAGELARVAGGINYSADSVELVIYNPRLFELKTKDKNYLAWNVTLADEDGPARRVFIDAQTGKVLESWPLIKTAAFGKFNTILNPKIIRATLGSDTISRRVYDCRPDGCTQNTMTTDTVAITDPAVMRDEGQPATGNAQLDDLYNLLGKAFDYYKTTFDFWGANGLGGAGWSNSARFPLLRTTAYGYLIGTTTLGSCPNSWGGAGSLKFCDGTVNTTVVGHEYQHGVSAFNKRDTWGFDYKNESGAVEEAYADIFGQAITKFTDGASTWQIGRNNAAGVFRPWRNIIDPTNASRNISGTDCPCPEKHYGPEFYCGADDHGGVHRNSTVISHMAYILATGGNLNGCAVGAIGEEKVDQIFYHAFRHTLTSAPTFKDLYNGLVSSCWNLYGLWSDECKNLVLAAQGAQLDQEKACGAAGDAPLCNGIIIDPRGLANFGILKLNLAQPSKKLIIKENNAMEILPTDTPSAPITPPPVEEEVRTPSFDVTVAQNGKSVTINGVLHYYGKGAKCSGPRYFDPIIVRWGQVDSHPTLKSDNTFTASHDYVVKNSAYDLTVSVSNSCFGSHTFRKTLIFPF